MSIPNQVSVRVIHERPRTSTVTTRTRHFAMATSVQSFYRADDDDLAATLPCPECGTVVPFVLGSVAKVQLWRVVARSVAAASALLFVAAVIYAVIMNGQELPEGQSNPVFGLAIVVIAVTFVAGPLGYLARNTERVRRAPGSRDGVHSVVGVRADPAKRW